MRRVLVTIGGQIVTPILAYLALVGTGLPPVWALAVSAGVSVVVLVVGWVRSREISTLGLLVLVRFTLGIALAFFTGDAQLVLVKDYVVTFCIAVAAAVTLKLPRPFVGLIRRDLAGDRDAFDQNWVSARFRATHRRLTGLWVAGLLAEVVVAVVVIYSVPLTAAVVATNVITPVVLLVLIAVTETRGAAAAHRAEQEHHQASH